MAARPVVAAVAEVGDLDGGGFAGEERGGDCRPMWRVRSTRMSIWSARINWAAVSSSSVEMSRDALARDENFSVKSSFSTPAE